jgi:predicted enzyme related to lactoylglutathione lyase
MAWNHAISWFEIPSTDLERAQRFYETIFGIELTPMDFANIRMRAFPVTDPQNGIGGAVVDSGGFHKPSATDGPLIYLNGNPDVQLVLNKVEAAGGKVIVPKTHISEDIGYMGVFLDTEGNRIAIHSIPQAQ